MNITIDKTKTINHYCYDDKELFDILKDSVKTLMLMYERISKSDDDEVNKVYNIIDILWGIKLQS